MNENILRKELGLTIRRARRALDITQSELSKNIGCVVSYVCEMEKGNKPITTFTLYKLEKELGPLWNCFKK